MKASEFNIFVPSFFDGVYLAYNTFTGSFMSVGEDEFRRYEEIFRKIDAEDEVEPDALVAQLEREGFLIADDVDERAALQQRYFRGRDRSHATVLTIAPTISCNFGCTYCFQEHPKRKMSQEDVASLKKYVDDRLVPETELYITWFGGEPLMAFDVIMELCDYFSVLCKERRCTYTQSMITNGSLLDEIKVDFLQRQGNFKYLQITLDGPPEVHDRRRLYQNGRPTFSRILANLAQAVGKVPITIRVNIDRTNCDRLESLVLRLKEHGLRDRVNIYLGHVLPYTEVCADAGSVAMTKAEFATTEAEFDLMLLEHGFRPSAALPKPRFGNFCIADHPNGAVISPGGLVFRCWNEVATTADSASGLLEHGQLVVDEVRRENQAEWQRYDPFAHDMCRQCRVQPLCDGGCPWEARKNPKWSTGHCTTLKFNLADRLRMHHLRTSIDRLPSLPPMQPVAPDQCIEMRSAHLELT